MPCISLTNALTSSQVSGYLILRDSENPVVGSAFDIDQERDSINKQVDAAESVIAFRKIMGPP